CAPATIRHLSLSRESDCVALPTRRSRGLQCDDQDVFRVHQRRHEAFADSRLGQRWFSDLWSVRLCKRIKFLERCAPDDLRLRAARWPIRHEQSYSEWPLNDSAMGR